MTGTTIAQAIPLAVSPILTRLYTPEDFGLFALFIALTSVFVSFASGRYELAVMLPVDDKESINILALGLLITTALSTSLLLFITLFHDIILSLVNNIEIGVWLYFIPLIVLFTGLYNLLTYFNNRQKCYQDLARATIIKSLVLVAVQLGIGFVKTGATGLISGQILSSFFANMKLFKNILNNRSLLHSISKKEMLAMAKRYKDFPLYQAPHALLNTFSSNIPVYLFSSFVNATVVGFYALSTRIVFAPLMIIAGASAKVYNQKVTQLYNEGGDAYGLSIQLLQSLLKKICFPFVLLILFAPDIFALLFGDSWREAGLYTQILSPWLFMVFFVTTISFIPSLMNMQKKALLLEVIYSILRLLAITTGLFFHDVLLALALFSATGFMMLSYNMWWMLTSIKKGL